MSYGNCEKKHRTVASFTTNVNDPSTSSWDLTPYKTAGIGTPAVQCLFNSDIPFVNLGVGTICDYTTKYDRHGCPCNK